MDKIALHLYEATRHIQAAVAELMKIEGNEASLVQTVLESVNTMLLNIRTRIR